MNARPSPHVDSAISCGLVVGVICLTLLILAVIVIGVAEP
jgi:hypothetical protein